MRHPSLNVYCYIYIHTTILELVLEVHPHDIMEILYGTMKA